MSARKSGLEKLTTAPPAEVTSTVEYTVVSRAKAPMDARRRLAWALRLLVEEKKAWVWPKESVTACVEVTAETTEPFDRDSETTPEPVATEKVAVELETGFE